jgi:hypothetical protein
MVFGVALELAAQPGAPSLLGLEPKGTILTKTSTSIIGFPNLVFEVA